jgi:hypothetical protein
MVEGASVTVVGVAAGAQAVKTITANTMKEMNFQNFFI